MNVVEVIDGSCGFRTRIAVHLKDGENVGLTVSSDCQAAADWGRENDSVDWRQCLGRHTLQSPLFKTAMETLRHRSCPVLTAVLRAIETEVGAARPAEIRIRFLTGKTSGAASSAGVFDGRPQDKDEQR